MNRLNESYHEDVDPELEKLFELLRATPAREPRSIVQGEERFLAELDGLTGRFGFFGLGKSSTQVSPWSVVRGLHVTNGFKARPIRFRWDDASPGIERYPAPKKSLSETFLTWLVGLINLGTGKQRPSFISRVTLPSFIVVMLLVFGSAGFATAARSALPGQALYPLKTSLEQARISVTANPAMQANLYLSLAESRLNEMSSLMAAGHYDQVAPLASEFENYVRKAVAAVEAVAQDDPAQAAKLNARLATALSSFAQSLGGLLAGAPDMIKPDLQTAVETSQGALNREWAVPEEGTQESGEQEGDEKGEKPRPSQEPTPVGTEAPSNAKWDEQKTEQDGCQDNNGDGVDDQSNLLCNQKDGSESGINQQTDDNKSDGQEYDHENDSSSGVSDEGETNSGEHPSSDDGDGEHDGDHSGGEIEGFTPQYGLVA